MKSKLFLVVMSVVLVFCLSACSKNNNANQETDIEKAIIGEWTWVWGMPKNMAGISKDEFLKESMDELPSDGVLTVPESMWVYTFNEDGSFIEIWPHPSQSRPDTVNEGTWRIVNGTLKYTYSSSETKEHDKGKVYIENNYLKIISDDNYMVYEKS